MLYPSIDLELAPMMKVHDDDNEVRVTTRGNEKVVGLGSGGGGGRQTNLKRANFLPARDDGLCDGLHGSNIDEPSMMVGSVLSAKDIGPSPSR
ncbi:hypothetical protein OsI_18923 [Oryza sativa Indica Group]|uniref:Uncharacterized protein n=1 Tax=Oryza sativa subsp. indica TaxID=39946 RepID=A2Y1P1_ORYSI|nr:hypothetical protein OsI_18923 [Oryza sativa Indica Group]